MVDVVWYIVILVLWGMIITGIVYPYFEAKKLRKENAILVSKLNGALDVVDSYQKRGCACDGSDSEVPEWFMESEHYNSNLE